jgi:hypothetical protein
MEEQVFMTTKEFLTLVLIAVLGVVAVLGVAWVKNQPTITTSREGVAITVDHEVHDAVAMAIEENKFDDVQIVSPIEDIPVSGNGKVTHEVFQADINGEIENVDLLKLLDKNGLALVDPLTALRYATKLPDRQRLYSLGTLFEDRKGQLCCLRLYHVGTLRILRVTQESPKNWGFAYHFLVVRKSDESSRRSVDQSSISATNGPAFLSATTGVVVPMVGRHWPQCPVTKWNI